MGEFSLEPPRKDLIVHHTFDHTDDDLDRVVDLSPQASDAQIVGNVDVGVTGIIGQAARLLDESADINISGASQFFPLPSVTYSAWGKSERPVPAGSGNVQADITVGGTTYTLSHNLSEEVDEWQYAALVKDGDTATLYYALESDDHPRVVDEVTVGTGDVSDASLDINTEGYGDVDDVRLYRAGMADWLDNLHEMGAEHNMLNELHSVWDNPAIPLNGPNEELAGALAEEKDEIERQLDAMLQARHIDDAAGDQLDHIGGRVVQRKDGEGDARYRARIKARMAAGRSSGTFDDILEAVATILNVEVTRIEIKRSAEPADATVYVRRSDLDNTPLTTGDLTTIMQDLVPAGHSLNVVEQGSQPFTVIDDTMTTDPEKGLTSDSIATGGGLVSDV